jgi:cytochrome c-type biogenesis protein CcmE
MKRARWIVAAVVCAVAIVFMVTQLGANLNYMEPVSKAVAQRDSNSDRRIRIGGIVLPGSLEDRPGGGSTFELTEGGVAIHVDLAGAPHQTVTENPDGCAPVVVEGRWNGERFSADRMLLRHGSTYDAEAHAIGDEQARLDCGEPSAPAGTPS